MNRLTLLLALSLCGCNEDELAKTNRRVAEKNLEHVLGEMDRYIAMDGYQVTKVVWTHPTNGTMTWEKWNRPTNALEEARP